MALSSSPTPGGLLAALRRVPRKAWLRMAILVAILASGFVLVRFTPAGDVALASRTVCHAT